MRRASLILAVIAAVAVIIASGLYLTVFAHHPHAGHDPLSYPRHPSPSHPSLGYPSGCAALPKVPVTGVAVHPPVAQSARAFVVATHTPLKLTEFYSRFGRPFNGTEALQAEGIGTVPVIQIDPVNVSLLKIAEGGYTHYLRQFDASIKRFRCPVILSFGHEMNGNWYSWSCSHVSPSVFINAWRTIVNAAKHDHVRNASWMWTTNVETKGDCPLRALWPGLRYVNLIGIDGYMRKPRDTFAGTFDPTIVQVRELGPRLPIILSEVGVTTGRRQAARITNLYENAARQRLSGIIYFIGRGKRYLGSYFPASTSQSLKAFQQGVAHFLGKE
jgi:hypothetical protein